MTYLDLWNSQISLAPTLSGTQDGVQVAAFADGSFVAVWTDDSLNGTAVNGEDTDGSAVRGQIFNADGTKRGSAFLINSTTGQDQLHPTVAVLSDGRFAVAWQDYHPISDDNVQPHIRARVFNADGTAFDRPGFGTGDFLVNQDLSLDSETPSIAALANGGFVISYGWTQEGATSPSRLNAQSFDAQGNVLGSEQALDRVRGFDGTKPVMIGLGNNYAVIESKGGDGFSDTVSQIHGIIRKANGSAVAEFNVSGTDAVNIAPAATLLKDGRFVVAWAAGAVDATHFDFKAQIYNADGTASGGPVTLVQNVVGRPVDAIAPLTGGGFTLAYLTADGANGTSHIHAMSFDANGQSSSNDLVVADSGVVWPYEDASPSMATLADGRMIVTWHMRGSEDYALTDVYGQIIDPNGTLPSTPPVTPSNPSPVTPDPGTGIHHFVGGPGNDTYIVDNALDLITDSGGIDTVITSIDYTLGAGLEYLIAAAGMAPLVLTGNASANLIIGNAGANRLDGGPGADTLTGGAGRDLFVFHKPASKKQIDTVTDFSVKAHDRIGLDHVSFKHLGHKGMLKQDAFWTGSSSHDSSDRVVYNPKTGALFFDPDGNGPAKQIEIAKLNHKPHLHHDQIFIL